VTADHAAHSKRALAADLLAAMSELGHDAFVIAGHDRGGRVAYRMALDHPASVSRLAVLDIVPTGQIWSRADAAFAIGYWHWAFLAQPAPLPEQMILGNPDAFWIWAQRLGLRDDVCSPQEVLDAYRAQCADPNTVAAMCEDYRAGATIDRQLDEADRGRRTIACPVLALWGSDGALPRFYDDPLDLWRIYAPQITGHAIKDASHFLAEDAPAEVTEKLLAYLG
jgi:haloacetate dehalogenase